MPGPQRAHAVRLGRIGYAEAWAEQRRRQAALVADKRRPADAGGPRGLPHTLLVAEHPPVFTTGPSGSDAHLLLSPDDLEARGAALVRTDRGGDVTFHGPGQLVVYPILDLDRLHAPARDGRPGEPLRDLHRFLRALEEAVISACADVGVGAGRVPGRTGVWVGPDAHGPERKVCAMGIRCSRWVTMHGLALNVSTDLHWFDLIVPCGIADRGVTSLTRETALVGEPAPDAAAVERSLLGHLARELGLDLRDAPVPAPSAPPA